MFLPPEIPPGDKMDGPFGKGKGIGLAPASGSLDAVGAGDVVAQGLPEGPVEFGERLLEKPLVHPLGQPPGGPLGVAQRPLDALVDFKVGRRIVPVGRALLGTGQGVFMEVGRLEEPDQKGQKGRGQGKDLPVGPDLQGREVDGHLGGAHGALGGPDRIGEASRTRQQGGRKRLAQTHHRDLGQGHLGVRGIHRLAVRQRDDHLPPFFCGVEEVGKVFERGGDEDMGDPVLLPAEEGEGIPGIEAHGLASSGEGDVEVGVGIAAEVPDGSQDAVGGIFVLLRRPDVGKGPPVSSLETDQSDVPGGERDLVVPTQTKDLARLGVEQGLLGMPGPVGRAHDHQTVRNEGVLPTGEGIEGLGHHLGGGAGHADEDAGRRGAHSAPFLVGTLQGSPWRQLPEGSAGRMGFLPGAPSGPSPAPKGRTAKTGGPVPMQTSPFPLPRTLTQPGRQGHHDHMGRGQGLGKTRERNTNP